MGSPYYLFGLLFVWGSDGIRYWGNSQFVFVSEIVGVFPLSRPYGTPVSDGTPVYENLVFSGGVRNGSTVKALVYQR